MGYLQDRDRRIAGFEDTLELCRRNRALAHAIQKTRTGTRCYWYKDGTSRMRQLWSRIKNDRTGLPWIRSWRCQANEDNISVTQERSLEAVRHMRRLYPQSRIAVLQFASGTNPGGGVIRGGVGQEEDLCRCSILYPCLQAKKVRKQFYNRHRVQGNPCYTDTCLYLPGIIGIREEIPGGALLSEEEWYTFDVITCAPPNMRMYKWEEEHGTTNVGKQNMENVYNMESDGIDRGEGQLIERRVRRIIQTAIRNRVDILVLGAFGCGMYGNSPEIVANAFKKALNECKYSFRAIVFAIHSESETNYNVFSVTL